MRLRASSKTLDFAVCHTVCNLLTHSHETPHRPHNRCVTIPKPPWWEEFGKKQVAKTAGGEKEIHPGQRTQGTVQCHLHVAGIVIDLPKVSQVELCGPVLEGVVLNPPLLNQQNEN